MSSFLRGQRKDAIIAACVALVASFLFFGNGISGPFILDDTIVIVGNPLIDGQASDVVRAFGEPYHFHQPRTGIYRPLTIASYSLNWFLFGESPVSFHVINILLHAGVAWMIFHIVMRLTNRRAAYAAMGLFLVLPIHVEAVTSIVGRAELLAALGVLVGFSYALKERYALSAVAFLLGLFAKETAVALIPIVMFAEVMWKKLPWKRAARNVSWYLVPSVVYGAARYAVLGKEYFLSNDATGVYNPLKFTSFFPAFWTSCKVLFLYLSKTFVPLHFSSDYSFRQIPIVDYPWQSLETMAGIALLVVITVILFRYRHSFVALGLVIFLSSYFIVSNWVFKIGTVMGERLMYVPSIGLVMVCAWLWVKVWERFGRQTAYALAGIILAVFAIQTLRTNRLWLDERALFENAYAQSPQSVVSQTNKAYLLLLDGKPQEAGQIIDRAVQTAPDHAPALNLAGHVLKRQGKLAEAEAMWKRAIAARKDYLRAYLSLGILYYENGYLDSAVKVLEDAVAIYPRTHEVTFLGLSYVAQGQYDRAIEVMTKYFGTHPQDKELRFALGAAYLKKGDRTQAETYLRQVVPLHLTFEQFIQTVAEGRIFNLGSSIQ